MGTDEAKNWQKKVEKITIPRVLSEMASVQNLKIFRKTFWTWKIELIRTEVLSYVQSKKHSIHLSDYILYPVLFLFTAIFTPKMVIFRWFFRRVRKFGFADGKSFDLLYKGRWKFIKMVILLMNGHFKQNIMVFGELEVWQKFLKFMNNHECIIWKISLGRIS